MKEMAAEMNVSQTLVNEKTTGRENAREFWDEEKCASFPEYESPEKVEEQDAFEWEGTSLKEETYTRCLSELTNGQFTEDMIFDNYVNGLFKNPHSFYNPYTKRGVTVCAGAKNIPRSEVLMRMARHTPAADC